MWHGPIQNSRAGRGLDDSEKPTSHMDHANTAPDKRGVASNIPVKGEPGDWPACRLQPTACNLFSWKPTRVRSTPHQADHRSQTRDCRRPARLGKSHQTRPLGPDSSGPTGPAVKGVGLLSGFPALHLGQFRFAEPSTGFLVPCCLTQWDCSIPAAKRSQTSQFPADRV